ncbi:MAG: DMT family transporter [Kofleriaceae bacterium]|nr:DMT family transporter [Kofleriaceae bacterium]
MTALSPRAGRWLLVLAIVAISTAAPFIRWAAPAPAASVAALRVTLAALVLTALAPRAWRLVAALPRRQQLRIVAAGLLFATHLGVWIASLAFTSTAASVALVATNPVFAALLSPLTGDRVGARAWLGIGVAGLGCALLAGGDWRAGGDALLGDLLALAGAATAAGYLAVGRSLRAALPLTAYLAVVNQVAALGLLVAALLAGAPLLALAPHSYLAIAGGAVIASLGGHTLLNLAVRSTPTHLVALAILGEPVGATLLTWALFAEVPPAHAALGGAVILGGIVVGITGRRR